MEKFIKKIAIINLKKNANASLISRIIAGAKKKQ